jgi:hypothetical protein
MGLRPLPSPLSARWPWGAGRDSPRRRSSAASPRHSLVGWPAWASFHFPKGRAFPTSSGASGRAVVVETIFNIPGIGRLIISAVLRRDYPVIQGVVLCVAGVYMLINLLVDLSYLVIDPRVRYG